MGRTFGMLRRMPQARGSLLDAGASHVGHGEALISRSFARERAVQRNKHSACPHVSGGRPVGLHRIEV